MDLILDEILHVARMAGGVDLSGYRRSLVARRVRYRMAVLGLSSETEYLRRLQDDLDEAENFQKLVLINVSEFFRDPIVFETLADRVLTDLLTRKRAAGDREIRVWCAGCASGEEIYSVAILLRTLLGREAPTWRFFLFGSDIDERALEQAVLGCYPPDRMANVKLGLVKKWFTPSGEKYQLREEIRSMVSFTCEDLLSGSRVVPRDCVFSEFDVVICRNVLIYFTIPQQHAVMQRLSAAVKPGGVLVLGKSEDIDLKAFPGLQAIERRQRIFEREVTATASE